MIFFAQTAANQSDLVVKEALRAGAENVRATASGVQFSASLETGYRFTMTTRIASRVLLALYFDDNIDSPEKLYESCMQVPWHEYLTPEMTFQVTQTVQACNWLKNSHFAALKLKDAIVDRIKEETGGSRPDVDKENSDCTFHLHIKGKNAIIYADFSGEGLYRRGYRSGDNEAVLKEHLASAVLYRSEWYKSVLDSSPAPLLDPFCGLGTIPVEAAQIAADIAPGLTRKEPYAFEKLFNFDEEAYNLWRSLGVSEKRIAKLPKEDNWWGPAGQTGPCGPDTEMFYWTGPMPVPEVFDPKDKRWVEIWNDVFMQYNKTADGKFIPMEKKNVDTGMGVERVTAILQGKASCYDTEIFQPLFEELDKIRGIETPAERTRSERIVVEHMRAATFILADGITPGKVDQAYILRRLIRRAIREAKQAGVTVPFTKRLAKVVIDNYCEAYPELKENETMILEEFEREETMFKQTLENGEKEFEKFISRVPAHIQNKVISGKNAFYLYETFGFPIELTVEMAKEKGFTVDLKGYEEAFHKHQELSRKGAEQKFKGGLADHSAETACLHTATHLLHKALRIVLGDHVAQKGSNINAERLRFDFSHPDKMTPEQIAEVERLVNEVIQKKYPVVCEEMSLEDARKSGAIGLFGNKYGERVTVYSMGDFSKEICGGPHASNTGDLISFKIQKEESSSRGVRRIKATIGFTSKEAK